MGTTFSPLGTGRKLPAGI